jgi:hypothetical protein
MKPHPWSVKINHFSLPLTSCAPEWDFLFLLEQGILPQDLCARESYCT